MIHYEEIEYYDNDVRCLGFLAYNKRQEAPRPCVLIAHDWGGRGEATCQKAIKLAEMGYVAFAIDMYGNAQLGQDKLEKRALMTPLKENRKALAARIIAAFNAALQLPQVDRNKIAAIGYCFGGLCVLDLARRGLNIKGAVSFHGVLSAPDDPISLPILAKILILHGYDDPLVLPEEVNQFALEMTSKRADWQVHMYGLTEHSFTDPSANDNEMGLHYNETADKRSWKSMSVFLQEIFS